MTVTAGTGNRERGTGTAENAPFPVPFSLLPLCSPAPGWLNMARDQAMLDRVEAEGGLLLRLYQWDPPCLSFGRNESVLKRYHRDQIEQLKLDVVRRPTGGRAVWHEQEVTYAVAGRVAQFGSLGAAYCALHQFLAAALRRLDAEVTIAGNTPVPGLSPGGCFSAPVGGEIMYGNRKLVGSAQLRQGEAFLQHGSILLQGTQEIVARVSQTPAPEGGESSLSDALDRAVSFQAVAAAIMDESGAEPIETNWLDRAASAREAHFRSPEWTWRR
jgi:lipoate---protein ligase